MIAKGVICCYSKGLQSQMNSKIFSDLLEFIKSAHKAKSVESARTTVIHEIPTAALITGGLPYLF